MARPIAEPVETAEKGTFEWRLGAALDRSAYKSLRALKAVQNTLAAGWTTIRIGFERPFTAAVEPGTCGHGPVRESTGIAPRLIRSARVSPSMSSMTRKLVSPSFSKP